MIKKAVLTSMLFSILMSCMSCSNNDTIVKNDTLSLEEYLKKNADYVHNIYGFYIVGSASKPKEATPNTTTGKEIFEHSVRLFSSFLDQNNDGEVDDDKKNLNQWLAQKTMFISGPLKMVDKISEASQLRKKGLYGMSMQTDNWPYVKNYNGKGWTLDKLSSSTWRPQVFNALWEEVFHTVTEAISRTDNEFAFTNGKKLRQFMEDDIAAKTYDISEQNAAENGNYDKVTAVNEYIHQIWAINFAGLSEKLNSHQKKALEFMKTKKVPMSIDAKYNRMIGTKIK
ncbi:conserved exported protein of unknown function [Tenacibaculum sp. 190130A14a]|uniref:Uncharacterized protein n=1 Tax=Tenacibaculum polynesiense TaxID=3137857 RepID=A0ABM9P9U6_9FLAO